ncbi:agamous-like MADS-box protein AGL80 [Cicer arietinum]|uniref:Agamous-like MADS-box protein AGL80 n=1 Tax=Cicer arietinum TaxID=3827 RepID=A0A3Q7X8S0_CICAR|nr:agamous-like MADS-box protein AGL80 [Cicer arietinum]
MARKKVKLAYIINHSNRKATYKKRKYGLLKKISELSILCGIDACAIIYGENNPRAEVWPSTIGARSVLSKFMRLPELERRKKMVDLEGFLTQSIAKVQDSLKKQMEENQRKQMSYFISHFIHTGEYNPGNVNLNDLNDLTTIIDNNLKEIEGKLSSMEVVAEEETGNRVEPMHNHVGVQERETNMNYAMKSDDEHLPLDLPFDDVNIDTNGLWSI